VLKKKPWVVVVVLGSKMTTKKNSGLTSSNGRTLCLKGSHNACSSIVGGEPGPRKHNNYWKRSGTPLVEEQ
jgi:hypothetical protein